MHARGLAALSGGSCYPSRGGGVGDGGGRGRSVGWVTLELQKSGDSRTSAKKHAGSRRGVALELRCKEGGGWGKRSGKKVSPAQVLLLEGSLGDWRPPS